MKTIIILLLVHFSSQFSLDTVSPSIRLPQTNISLTAVIDDVADSFQFCSYVLIDEMFLYFLEPRIVIFSFKLPFTTIDVVYYPSKSLIGLDVDDSSLIAMHDLRHSTWFQFCLQVDQNEVMDVIINEQRVELKEKWFTRPVPPGAPPRGEIYDDLYPIMEDYEITEETEIPFQSVDPRKRTLFSIGVIEIIGTELLSRSFIGEVTGVSYQNKTERSSDLIKRLVGKSCLNLISSEFLKNFTFSNKSSINTLMHNVSSISVCLDIRTIMVYEALGNYEKHASICNAVKGRFLSHDESTEFQESVAKQLNKTNCLVNSEFWNYEYWYWIQAYSSYEEGCWSYASYGYTQNCLWESRCVVCIKPSLMNAYLYSSVDKFGHNFIHLDSDLMIGKDQAVITRRNESWELRSPYFEDVWTLRQVHPFQRTEWSMRDVQTMLTLTFCSSDEFSCSNGDCIDKNERCDGIKNCEDNSDEEACVDIETLTGYNSLQPPPSLFSNLSSIIEYYTYIYTVNDISVSKGEAIMDVAIVLHWKDPRLRFWNPKSAFEYDCSKIWTPVLILTDLCGAGFAVDYKVYKRTCALHSIYQQIEMNYTKPITDSYMGRYVEGDSVSLMMSFHGIVTVPCRFHLQQYPFGKQKCRLCFRVDNSMAQLEGRENFKRKSRINYNGRMELGEFTFIKALHSREDDNTSVLIEIHLQSLYTFHILNSFTPSVLICVISYSTLFYPVACYNERIMVCLTSLLVLAALFSQATDSSIKTPYIKYLDIWYVVLILYCFILVLFNAIMLKYHSEKNSVTPFKGSKSCCRKYFNLDNINRISQYIFALIFTMFLLIFFLAAHDVI